MLRSKFLFSHKRNLLLTMFLRFYCVWYIVVDETYLRWMWLTAKFSESAHYNDLYFVFKVFALQSTYIVYTNKSKEIRGFCAAIYLNRGLFLSLYIQVLSFLGQRSNFGQHMKAAYHEKYNSSTE